jgi:hypothetical protein
LFICFYKRCFIFKKVACVDMLILKTLSLAKRVTTLAA